MSNTVTTGSQQVRARRPFLIFSARLTSVGGLFEGLMAWLKAMRSSAELLYAPVPGDGKCSERVTNAAGAEVVVDEVDTIGARSMIGVRLRAAKSLVRRLHSEPLPDVVMSVGSDSDIVNYIVCSIARAIYGTRVRVVCYCAGYPVPWHLRNGSLKGLVYKFFLKLIYPRVDHVIAISREMKREMVADFNVRADRITIVPISIPVGVLRAVDLKMRSQTQTVLTFGVISRLNAEKFISHAVRAFARVLADLDLECRLAVYGDGPARQSLESLVSELKISHAVSFLGHANICDALRAVDCLLVCSEHEGTPRTILEVGCVGIPTIATSVGGVPDIIIDGVTGWLYKYGDLDQLAELMCYVAKNSAARVRVGMAMQEYVARVHTPEQEWCLLQGAIDVLRSVDL